MGIIRSTVRIGEKPTKEQLKQIREIAKKPIHNTEDCPESTPEALAEFAAMARARRQRKTKPMVALRLEPETLEKYQALGRGTLALWPMCWITLRITQRYLQGPPGHQLPDNQQEGKGGGGVKKIWS
jgi:uncharacterized protein (DUF4415 family)